jgi:hypothetical protein
LSTRSPAFSVSPTSSSVEPIRASVLGGRQAVEERRRPELDADPPEQRARARPRRLAEHTHVAGVGSAQALDDLERGRLAGAVRTEDAEDLALADAEETWSTATRSPYRFTRSSIAIAAGGIAGSVGRVRAGR